MPNQPKKDSAKVQKFFSFIDSLTSREKDVACLLLMNKGMRYEEIAHRLYLQSSTIRGYASNIYKKASVRNKKELLAFCEGYESLIIGHQPATKNQPQPAKDTLETGSNTQYFEAFSDMAEAMHQLDFSKRLAPSGDKNSFFNLVAEGLNLVNEELESKFLAHEIIPQIMESLRNKNRIVFLAKKNHVIAHAFSSIGVGRLKPQKWVGLNLTDFVGEKVELNGTINNEKVELTQDFIPEYLRGEAEFSLKQFGAYSILTISVFSEHNLSEQMPRILTFISSLKSQFDDNPTLSQTIVGAWVYNEVNELYKELEAFILT